MKANSTPGSECDRTSVRGSGRRVVVELRLRSKMLAHFWMRLNSGSEILNSTLGGVALGGSNRALAGTRALKLPRDGPEGDHFLGRAALAYILCCPRTGKERLSCFNLICGGLRS